MISFEKRVFLGAGAFVVFIFSLVIACIKQDFSLVADNYYENEINYQEHIDKVKNTNALDMGLSFVMSKNYDLAEFKFPSVAIANKQPAGTIHFFRPSDAEKDVKLEIAVDENFEQKVKTSSLEKGLWKVKVDWSSGGSTYYNEFTLVMQ